MINVGSRRDIPGVQFAFHFAGRLLECLDKGFVSCVDGNDAPSINVTEKEVAGTDADASDFNGNAEIHDLIARSRVLRVRTLAERGQV